MSRRRSPAADALARMGAKRCRDCGAAKPLDAFRMIGAYPYAACRNCERIAKAVQYHTPEETARRKEYLGRPEVKAARKASAARLRSTRRRRDQVKAYRESLIGRLRHARAENARRLRAATAPERVGRLERLVALYDREIARITREAS